MGVIRSFRALQSSFPFIFQNHSFQADGRIQKLSPYSWLILYYSKLCGQKNILHLNHVMLCVYLVFLNCAFFFSIYSAGIIFYSTVWLFTRYARALTSRCK
ncbi:hypothetical protein TSAR_008869 [Trichomalopsis sarcophagae]|uniref:Uncharacterized protein n=1 Tax=Trichomalopsis sarcophagae TaxID=543379 RepID=A0A232FBM4_9HYME|nr:hypothetical protein TSAR_008869 [Trichomalopsis sarcophagae]